MTIPDIVLELLDRQLSYLDTLANFAAFLFAICGFVIIRQAKLINDDEFIPVRAFWMVPIISVISASVILIAFIGQNLTMSFVQDSLRLVSPCIPEHRIDCSETPLIVYREDFKSGLQRVRLSAFLLSVIAMATSLIWLGVQLVRRKKNDASSDNSIDEHDPDIQ